MTVEGLSQYKLGWIVRVDGLSQDRLGWIVRVEGLSQGRLKWIMRVEGLSQERLEWIVSGRIESRQIRMDCESGWIGSRQIRMDCESGGRQMPGSGDTVQEQRSGRTESRNWEPLRKPASPQTFSRRSDDKKPVMCTRTLTVVSSPFSEFSVRSSDLSEVSTNLLLFRASASCFTPLAVMPVWARFRCTIPRVNFDSGPHTWFRPEQAEIEPC